MSTTFSRPLNLDDVDQAFRDRFWSKVDRSGDCWTWSAYRKPGGYGQFTVRKGYFRGAHCVAYALEVAPIEAGQVVCHRCDNPPCVNPSHLFAGTQSDNGRDMVHKGRSGSTKGTARANAVLDDDAVRAIRATPSYLGVMRDLSARFGVSATTIRKVRQGQKWGHVA